MDNSTDTRPAAPAVYGCIAAVMGDIGREGIGKNRKNQGQGFNFRGIDDVYNGLNQLLAKHGLVVIPRMTERDLQERTTAKGGIMFYVTVTAEFDLVAAADGSMHTARAYGEAMDSADKATNKAMSAAFKYMAFQVFCIPVEGQDDADAHSPEPLRPQPSVRQAAQSAVWAVNVKEAVTKAKTAKDLDGYLKSDTFTKGLDTLSPDRRRALDKFIADRFAEIDMDDLDLSDPAPSKD